MEEEVSRVSRTSVIDLLEASCYDDMRHAEVDYRVYFRKMLEKIQKGVIRSRQDGLVEDDFDFGDPETMRELAKEYYQAVKFAGELSRDSEEVMKLAAEIASYWNPKELERKMLNENIQSFLSTHDIEMSIGEVAELFKPEVKRRILFRNIKDPLSEVLKMAQRFARRSGRITMA